MIYRKLMLLAFLLVSHFGYADVYLYLHRSSSIFETKNPLSLKVNYVDVTKILPGEWKLIILQGSNKNMVLNLAFPEGVKDDDEAPCSFPRKIVSGATDSIQFLTLGDEFCDMRILPRQRSFQVLSNGATIQGFRLNGKTVTPVPTNEVSQITTQLIGLNLEANPQLLSINDIDSLKALALEALELRKKLAAKEAAMKEQLEEYFELMKAINSLDENVKPLVHMGMEEGVTKGSRVTYNVRATFSYDIVADGVKAELVHYPVGEYLLDKSAAALATAFSMRKSIQNYMSEYFEPGSLVKIRIIGSADAQKINRPIPYRGEYQTVNNQEFYITDDYQIIYTENPEIDSTVVDRQTGKELMSSVAVKPEPLAKGTRRTIDVNPSTVIAENETLAYLRSHGIRDYMLSKIPDLKRTRNEFLHQVKIEKGIGGRFRKVVIELLIEDVLRSK